MTGNSIEAGSRTTKAERTRLRILEAAAGELADHGYAGASVRNIAARAGLHPSSLAFHFTTKDDLVAAAMQEGIDFAYEVVSKALRELNHDEGAATRLRCAITAHLAALHASHARSAVVLRVAATLPPQLRREFITHSRRYGQLWLALLQDAATAGVIAPGIDLRGLRDVIFGALNSTLTGPGTPQSVARVEQTLVTLLATDTARP